MNKKSVALAMSGGVDSSAAAFLLKKKGYSVTGVTFDFKPNSILKAKHSDDFLSNVASDSKKTCKRLNIPHYVVDCAEKFDKEVIQQFIKSYKKGLTPNPCVICNQKIKFPLLLKTARKLKIQYIATGHYAKCAYDKKKGCFVVRDAKDSRKNQSYVLFGLKQDVLSKLILPLGNITKKEVYSVSKREKLSAVHRKESQEICFVEDNDLNRFLENNLAGSIRHGLIKDKEGNILGEHKGTCFYTIGQRKGLRIPYGKPIYVTDIIHKRGDIIAGLYKDTLRKSIKVRNINWIVPLKKNKKKLKVHVKIRYRNRKSQARLTITSPSSCEVIFKRPQSAPAPGQAAVFYRRQTVLGGGWITK